MSSSVVIVLLRFNTLLDCTSVLRTVLLYPPIITLEVHVCPNLFPIIFIY